MKLQFKPMNQAEAEEIANWEYEEPYSFYNMKNDEEDFEELLNPNARKGIYFSIYNDNALIGFFTFTVENDVVDIGLGLKPSLTGKGLGKDVLLEGLAFAKERYQSKRFSLAVAAFNKRAIKVYEKVGFKPQNLCNEQMAENMSF